uniref:DM domain-containing protein n=1 Tax=Knipowitschia caucasica TaxID=637954 RepID=A0AAV2K301_KNICA
MSCPREKPETPRQPKCTRCRHHGLVVPQKGHAKKCPFSRCCCWKCRLITERTRINAMQRQLERGPGEAEARGIPKASEPPEAPSRTVTRAPPADSRDPDPPREPDPPQSQSK